MIQQAGIADYDPSALSLYIHIPWCVKKCPYCDFNSHQADTQLSEQAYIDALIADLESHSDVLKKRTIQTIFIGGGTPSLFSAASYERLLSYIQQHFSFNPAAEITLEANPGAVEYQRFEAYRAIGINRLSLGIQSFNDAMLKKLGRIHDVSQAALAIESARRAGFDNFNIDLMHGLPDQTLELALKDVSMALAFEPPHLSWYQLTIEPNTVFYKQQPVLPPEQTLLAIEEAGFELLQHYHHYEVSAFCKPQHACQHNLNYWQFGDYLGIGAGAHSKLNINGEVVRFEKRRMPKDYLRAPQQDINQRTVTGADLVFEFMLMVTRLNAPISKALFVARTGQPSDSVSPLWKRAIHLELLAEQDDAFVITSRGRRYLNELQALFLP